MKTSDIFCIGVAALLFVQTPCSGDLLSRAHGMSFHALDERTPDSSPNIKVTFPDGYTDRLVLQKHYFNNEDRMTSVDSCNYIGHLENEKDACVAMTGCLGSDNIELTILSIHAPDSTGFVWTKEGDVHSINLNQNINHGASKDAIKKESRPQDLLEERFSSRSIDDDVCYFLKPPATALLNVKVAYDEDMFKILQSNETLVIERVKAVFVHVQAQFCHPSLGTKIHVNLQNADNPIFVSGRISFNPNGHTAGNLAERTTQVLTDDPSTRLMVYLSFSTGGGVSNTGSPCSRSKLGNKRSTSGCGVVNEYGGAIQCSNIVRHELGHNIGMGHSSTATAYPSDWDCGPKGPIMGGNDKEEWSPCSVMDFRRMYTIYSDDWCLPTHPTACTLDVQDESISYFQIKDANDKVLDSKGAKLFFSTNEQKDSQFWYLHKQPNKGDYGYIGSKSFYDNRRVLSIAFTDDFKNNDNVLAAIIIRLKSLEGFYLAANQDRSVYLATEDSENSQWEVRTSENDKIQLRNVGTTRFLHQKSGGNVINTFNNGDGIEWTLHGTIAHLNQISLESYRNRFVSEENDMVFPATTDSDDSKWTVEVVPLCGETGWCEIKHASTTNTLKEYQMWKIDGNSLISEFRDATLAIHGDNVLSTNIGDGEVTETVSIDGSTTTSFGFPLTECADGPEASPNGTFTIKNSETGQYLSFSGLKVSLSETSGSETEWHWVPKEGIKVNGAWGFIHNSNNHYLSIGKCPDKNSPCSLKLQIFNGNIEQHWRKWNKKIISKKNLGRKSKVVVLTLNSAGNVNAKTPDNDENQDWTLE